MLDQIRQLKEQGEIASERGDYGFSLGFLDKALVLALESKEYDAAVNILGHRLHVYKAKYKQTGDSAFLEMFYSDAMAGLRLAEDKGLVGQPKSVMFLRAGDYFLMKEDFVRAADQYHVAIEEFDKTGREAAETRAEYLGHYAFGLSKAGKIEESTRIYAEAFALLQSAPLNLREFHRMVVESGLLLRFAESLADQGHSQEAREALAKAKIFADDLAERFEMPDRQTQAMQLAKKLGD